MIVGPTLSVREFSELAGISHRKAREALRVCHEGGAWRGVQLDVRLAPAKGGPRGLTYQVSCDSLPPQLRPKPESVSVPAELPNLPEAVRSPITGDQAEADWRLSVIQPIRHGSEAGTPERAAMIREAASTVRYRDGKRRGKPVGEKTIRTWIAAYEARGIAGLRRKARSDAQERRVVISRQWDAAAAAAGISEAERTNIAAQLRKRVASLWSRGAPSWPTVQLSAMPFLLDLTCRAPRPLAPAADGMGCWRRSSH